MFEVIKNFKGKLFIQEYWVYSSISKKLVNFNSDFTLRYAEFKIK